MPNIKNFLYRLLSRRGATLLFGLICYTALLYRYSFQLGDFGDYISAGKLIIEGTNPYSQLMYVNSPVSAVFYFLFSKVFPLITIPAFIQFINLLGLYYFFKKVITQESQSALLLAFSILPLLNTTRALIANVQVTGIVLGLVAIAINLIKLEKSRFLIALPLWLSFETKPQLAIAFLAFFLFYKKIHFGLIAIFTLYVVISHSIVSILFGSSIDKLWIEKIARYSDASLSEGYEVSLWKALAIFTEQFQVIGVVSKLITIVSLLLIIYFSFKGKTQISFALAILFPIQNSYLHLYDLAPIALFALVLIIRNKDISSIFIVALFIQVYPSTPNGRYLSIILFLLFSFILTQSKKELKAFVISGTFFTGYIFLFSMFSSKLSEEMQIIISLVVPLAIYLWLQRRNIVAKIDSGMI